MVSSFPSQAARVRDSRRPEQRRILALRECALHFAPYGFRATWHHLVVSAGIPVRLEDDPESLVRAVDEIEEARRLWLAEVGAYTTRRLREKAAGTRQPRRADGWRTAVPLLAFCPEPAIHPTERLITVVGRLISAYHAETMSPEVCPVCGTTRTSLPCPHCGVCSWNPAAVGWSVPPPALSWRLIWQRAVPPSA